MKKIDILNNILFFLIGGLYMKTHSQINKVNFDPFKCNTLLNADSRFTIYDFFV